MVCTAPFIKRSRCPFSSTTASVRRFFASKGAKETCVAAGAPSNTCWAWAAVRKARSMGSWFDTCDTSAAARSTSACVAWSNGTTSVTASWFMVIVPVILDNLSKLGQTSFAMSGRQRSSQIRSHHFRINVLFPNRLSTRSTATIAVALRTSSAGFSSMMSSDASAPVSAIISMQSCASR
jgi:hypothetical protein